uniref:Uncharacterized protein n=1 Tax=Anguilla anguilla TaxID=7936 RepID=A0A0E9QM38_ANGAN
MLLIVLIRHLIFLLRFLPQSHTDSKIAIHAMNTCPVFTLQNFQY